MQKNEFGIRGGGSFFSGHTWGRTRDRTLGLAQREYVYGGGISPVAFQFTFRRGKRIQPFVVTDEGFLYFTRRILTPGSSQFNFTIDYGAGIQVFTSPRRAITLGYRYYHISNADIAINPGTDANLFFAGVSFFR
jgi:opacity protein-like surface antigen